jgi:hypothetical protein
LFAIFTEVAPTEAPTLTITNSAPGEVTLSWSPDTPGFVLQDNPDLVPENWMDSPSGSQNPVTLTTEGAKYFFRLIQP